MLDPNFDFGFNPATRSNYPELSDYNDLVVECAEKLRQTWDLGSYWKKVSMRDTDNLIIYHPLWSKNRLIAMAKSDNVSTEKLAIFNIFRVLRSDLDSDELPNNIDLIPAMALNDNGQLIDPNTGLVLGISL